MSMNMTTSPIDLDLLLAPISDEQPAGEWLRYDDLYDRIKEARREDDPDLPLGVWQTELKRADWHAVQDLVTEALATRSKDLQLAAWLLEARIQLCGFAGIPDALILLAQVCERFWETLYPERYGDDLEARLSPLHWMNEKLPLKLKHIPISRPDTPDLPVCAWTDWEQTIGANRPVAARDGEAEAGFRESVAATPVSFYTDLLVPLTESLNSLDALDRCLTALCDEQAPSLAQFREVLTRVKHFAARTVAERTGAEATVPAQVAGIDLTEEAEVGVGWTTGSAAITTLAPDGRIEAPLSASGAPVRCRADAYQRLGEIADFLLAIEPHSPAPYLIKRAVTWGRMPLAELLAELLQTTGDLQSIYTLLAINQGGEP